jgi:hypothetical protein
MEAVPAPKEQPKKMPAGEPKAAGEPKVLGAPVEAEKTVPF